MKKMRRDEPVRVIVHAHMEIPQRNSLCRYLYRKQTKMSFFFLFPFSSTKSENKRAEQILLGEGYEYGANTVYTCM
jgi:hypothetical protein